MCGFQGPGCGHARDTCSNSYAGPPANEEVTCSGEGTAKRPLGPSFPFSPVIFQVGPGPLQMMGPSDLGTWGQSCCMLRGVTEGRWGEGLICCDSVSWAHPRWALNAATVSLQQGGRETGKGRHSAVATSPGTPGGPRDGRGREDPPLGPGQRQMLYPTSVH